MNGLLDRKKITLAAVTFLIGVGSYFIFSWGDRRITTPIDRDQTRVALRKFVSQPTSQANDGFADLQMSFSPGEQTRVRVYDDVSGRLKYQLEAKKWEPRSETVYHVEDLQIEIYTPRGEITYINSDRAEITLARKSRNRIEPQRGWLRGNVRVIIDQTRAAWREAHPELAARDAHPDQLVHITLDEARFDLEQAELLSDSDILVSSTDARIENVRGLTVQWDQMDSRIDVLRFKEGGRMILRRGGKVIDFALPGTSRRSKKADPDAEAQMAASHRPAGRALAMKPMTVAAISADEAASQIRREGAVVRANQPMSLAPDPASPHAARTPSGGPVRVSDPASRSAAPPPDPNARTDEEFAQSIASMRDEARSGVSGTPLDLDKVIDAAPAKRRIQTYRAIFKNQVVVEQKDGLATTGKIEADQLEINFDFSRKQRDGESLFAQRSPATQPVQKQAPSKDDADVAADETRLILTWNGPLEMNPLSVNPQEQTGQRFDAVAIGNPVRLASDKGNGTCRQLVYRHERRQVWLAGGDDLPVELSVSPTRKLVGREVFFDQRRGLAHVEGPGLMLDDRSAEMARANSGGALPTRPGSEAGSRPPTEINFSRGVDIEIGLRPDLAGGRGGDPVQKEYLRRAWFHGDVSLRQGPDRLNADEVAVTFGLPRSREEVADTIEHLDMKGKVRLVQKGDLLSAERLSARMTIASDGRNVPHIIDASGGVVARQGRRDIQADKMHVVLGMYPGEIDRNGLQKFELGMEDIDASGNISVHDPASNLFITSARTLKASIRNGDQLVRARITSPSPNVLAGAAYSEMAVFGHRIDIDMDQQAIDIPGRGRAWMTSRSDFGGRKLSKPARVHVSWQDQMQFRLAKDYGIFAGRVRTRSEAFNLDCDKLTVRFGRAAPEPPPRPREKSPLARLWPWRLIASQPAQARTRAPRAFTAQNKKPVFILADGNAQAIGSSYLLAPADIGIRELMTLSMLTAAPAMMNVVPGETRAAICLNLARQTRRWELPFTPDPSHGRLLSRISVFGNQITSDLVREQMSVPGKGMLGIEDYQFSPRQAQGREAASGAGSGPLMSSLRSDGPSQTIVSWENGMDYFVDRGIVAFDQNVVMKHLSGRQMVEKEKLAEAFHISERAMRSLGQGRRATLSCGNLTLEFRSGSRPAVPGQGGALSSRATDLERLIAKSAVHLQENTRTVMGEYMQYLRAANEVRIEGGSNIDASISDQDERTQRLNMWRGPLLVWNRATNRIEAPQSVIRSNRR